MQDYRVAGSSRDHSLEGKAATAAPETIAATKTDAHRCCYSHLMLLSCCSMLGILVEACTMAPLLLLVVLLLQYSTPQCCQVCRQLLCS